VARNGSGLKRQKSWVVFWGCEGLSEENYAVFLNSLFKRNRIPVSLRKISLGKAGSVLAKIHSAKKRLEVEKRKDTKFKDRYIVMDIDVIGDDSNQVNEAEREALRHKITILWQRPCFEGFLIKHFEEIKDRSPSNCRDAEVVLKTVWADFKKPESVQRLTQKLDFYTNIKSLLTVEAEFKRVFESFGLKVN
jgi:hypothetical protein